MRYAFLSFLLLGSISLFAQTNAVVVDVSKKEAPVAKSMYGIFFEEINHAGDGGLYAEMLKNRSFEELEMPEGYHAEGNRLIPKPVRNHRTGRIERQTFKWTTEQVPGWTIDKNGSEAMMSVSKNAPKFASAPNSLEIVITKLSQPVRIRNTGYWGIGLVKDDKYQLRTIVRPSANYKGTIALKLISSTGAVLGSAVLGKLKAGQWNDVKAVLNASAKDTAASFVIELNATGSVAFDYVSLFPEKTFNQRSNGLRNDIANFLVDLKPSFMRWPGGCVVEGISLENRFEWKKTLGDPASRPGEYSTWGYRNTYGFGYYEFLQFCEDIKADGMFVCNVGMGCQFRMWDACTEDSVAYYLKDAMDAIEYAIGPVNSVWGAKRAADGHPKPFPLKYVEIGNENHGDLYDERFDVFYKAIKAKYPQLTLISNHGMTGTGKIAKTDMVDPHWYVAPDFFFNNSQLFDKQKRGDYTVYVGEYACNSGVGSGNMLAALSEAAFMTGMERNGDLVTMSSYAPLLQNKNDRGWAVNMIWHDPSQVMGRSSYYVQKMAADHRPDHNIGLSRTSGVAKPEMIAAGSIGLGTWETKADFKDIQVTRNGNVIKLDGSKFSSEQGQWQSNETVLSSTSLETATRRTLQGFSGTDYTLTFKVRKNEGKEGFQIYFALSDRNRDGLVFNVAGWGNTRTALQKVSNGRPANELPGSTAFKMGTDQWYDVKLEVTGDKAALSMDGKLILSYDHTTPPLQFFAAGYDEQSQEIILKVVNADKESYPVKFDIAGVRQLAATGKMISLTARDGNEENSFEQPVKIFPKESTISINGKNIEQTFAPFSYNVLRIKADRP